MNKITLYQHPLFGHSHRVRLFLSLLGIEAEIVDVDLAAGAHKHKEFIDKNRFGLVPVLEDGDTILSDSNAILIYLASKYDAERKWLPQNPVQAAEVQRFLSVAAGPIASGPAAARLINVFSAALDQTRAQEIATSVLTTLNGILESRDWLAGNDITIADISNYAYIAHAPEGDVSLDDYPHIISWLRRIESLPKFVPMQATAVGLAA